MSNAITIPPTEALALAVEGIDKSMGQKLVDIYTPLLEAAAATCAQAADVVVTDASQVTEIKASRALRLTLKTLRCEADKKRKELKAGVLQLGNAIDFGYKLLEKQIAPVEKRLEDQEKIAERMEAERQAKIGVSRFVELSPFASAGSFLPSAADLGTWPLPQYDAYLAGVKAEKQRADEAAEAELMRKEMEEAEAEQERRAQEAERKRLEAVAAEERKKRLAIEAEARIMAEKLRKENEQATQAALQKVREEQAARDAEREAQLKKERAEAQRQREAEQAEREKERKALEEKARCERAVADVLARKERQAREKAEAEALALRQAEEAKRLAEAEAARKAAAAPDKEKLMHLARDIRNFAQTRNTFMSTNAAAVAVDMVIIALGRLAKSVEDAAKEM